MSTKFIENVNCSVDGDSFLIGASGMTFAVPFRLVQRILNSNEYVRNAVESILASGSGQSQATGPGRLPATRHITIEKLPAHRNQTCQFSGRPATHKVSGSGFSFTVTEYDLNRLIDEARAKKIQVIGEVE